MRCEYASLNGVEYQASSQGLVNPTIAVSTPLYVLWVRLIKGVDYLPSLQGLVNPAMLVSTVEHLMRFFLGRLSWWAYILEPRDLASFNQERFLTSRS